MKVAIVFSGEPRELAKSYDSIKRSIIDGNDVDIFVHAWKSYDYLEILKYYDCKILQVQEQKDFEFFNAGKKFFCKRGGNIPSMFYSHQKVSSILLEYGKEYDFVVRARFDLSPRHRVIFTELNRENSYVSEFSWSGSHLFDDCWSISGYSTYLKIYNKIYDNFINKQDESIDRAEGCKYNHYIETDTLKYVARHRFLDFDLTRTL